MQKSLVVSIRPKGLGSCKFSRICVYVSHVFKMDFSMNFHRFVWDVNQNIVHGEWIRCGALEKNDIEHNEFKIRHYLTNKYIEPIFPHMLLFSV